MRLLRTAVHASVATRVIGSTQRRQHKRWAAEDAAAAPAAAPAAAAPAAPVAAPAPTPAATAPAGAPDPGVMIAQLQQLAQLRDAGVLTETEFDAQKQRILTGA